MPRFIAACVTFCAPLFFVSGLLAIPARRLLYRASPFFDHFNPEAFPVPWWEIVGRHGLFSLILCGGAAVTLSVFAARGRARLGSLLTTTAVVGAAAGGVAVGTWMAGAMFPFFRWWPLLVFLIATGLAYSICRRIRIREELTETPGWFF